MNEIPSDVAIWAMPRTGSTYIQQLVARGLWRAYGNTARNMHEAVSYGGMIPQWMELSIPIDFSDAIDPPDDRVKQELTYFHWYLAEQNNLFRKKIEGDPIDEVMSRIDIINEGAWKNNIVFKNMRWSTECRLHKELNELYDNAIINSPKNIHHIITWRRDTLSTVSSWMVMRLIKQSHGSYVWDGIPLEFVGDGNDFTQAYISTHQEFSIAINKLDPNKTVMVETSVLDNLDSIEWKDGYRLELLTRHLAANTKAENYVNLYVNSTTGQIVRPIDMLSASSQAIAENISKELEITTNWSSLDQYIGFRNYS